MTCLFVCLFASLGLSPVKINSGGKFQRFEFLFFDFRRELNHVDDSAYELFGRFLEIRMNPHRFAQLGGQNVFAITVGLHARKRGARAKIRFGENRVINTGGTAHRPQNPTRTGLPDSANPIATVVVLQRQQLQSAAQNPLFEERLQLEQNRRRQSRIGAKFAAGFFNQMFFEAMFRRRPAVNPVHRIRMNVIMALFMLLSWLPHRLLRS